MMQLAQQVGAAVLFGVCWFISIMIVGTLIIERREVRASAELLRWVGEAPPER